MLRYTNVILFSLASLLAPYSFAETQLSEELIKAQERIQSELENLDQSLGGFEELPTDVQDLIGSDEQRQQDAARASTLKELPRLQTGPTELWGEQSTDMQEGVARALDPNSQAALWEKVKDKLGVDTQEQLLIFISLSMPDNMLREYQLDAAATGASLVMKGIKDGQNLQEFRTETLEGIFGSAGVQAPVVIDPRQFDLFDISSVPTVVYTKNYPNEEELPCNEGLSCEKLPKTSYSSISGGVTLSYALEQFKAAGEPVGAFIEQLASFAEHDPDHNKEPMVGGYDKDSFLKLIQVVADRNESLLDSEDAVKGWQQFERGWIRHNTDFHLDP